MLLRFADGTTFSVPFGDEIVSESATHALHVWKSKHAETVGAPPDDARGTGRRRDRTRLALLGRAGVVQRARMAHV